MADLLIDDHEFLRLSDSEVSIDARNEWNQKCKSEGRKQRREATVCSDTKSKLWIREMNFLIFIDLLFWVYIHWDCFTIKIKDKKERKYSSQLDCFNRQNCLTTN